MKNNYLKVDYWEEKINIDEIDTIDEYKVVEILGSKFLKIDEDKDPIGNFKDSFELFSDVLFHQGLDLVIRSFESHYIIKIKDASGKKRAAVLAENIDDIPLNICRVYIKYRKKIFNEFKKENWKLFYKTMKYEKWK